MKKHTAAPVQAFITVIKTVFVSPKEISIDCCIVRSDTATSEYRMAFMAFISLELCLRYFTAFTIAAAIFVKVKAEIVIIVIVPY